VGAVDERVFEVRMGEVERRVTTLEEVLEPIRGNGTPGHSERLRLLETWQASEVRRREEMRRWVWKIAVAALASSSVGGSVGPLVIKALGGM
jgi:hypothetical protein